MNVDEQMFWEDVYCTVLNALLIKFGSADAPTHIQQAGHMADAALTERQKRFTRKK